MKKKIILLLCFLLAKKTLNGIAPEEAPSKATLCVLKHAILLLYLESGQHSVLIEAQCYYDNKVSALRGV